MKPGTEQSPSGPKTSAKTSKQRPKLRTDQIAEELLKTNHFAVDAGGHLYVYRDGVYRPNGVRHIKSAFKAHLRAHDRLSEWNTTRSAEVLGYIEADPPLLWSRPPLSTINLANGLLDLETRVIKNHDPSFLSTVQLPVAYDPDARCPQWEKFATGVLPPDCVDFPFELASWLMLPNRNVQKAGLLLGEGRNGKSTLLAAIVAFLGKCNCSGLSLHRLERDRFSAARLVGKLANICADIPSSHLESTSVFKTLTGDDPIITGERKGMDSFDFDCFSRLVFSANEPPRSADNTEAFFERWIVVPFEKFFGEGRAVPRDKLDAMLHDPSELSGVLNRALDCIPRIHLSTNLTETPSMCAARNLFRARTDPLAVWLDLNTRLDEEAFVGQGVLMDSYAAHCRASGKMSPTKTSFGTALLRLRPGIEKKQRTVDGEVKHVYLGIDLKKGPDRNA